MAGARRVRWAGPGIAVIGALAFVAATTAGAPGPAWGAPACPGAPGVRDASSGAWYQLDPAIADGVLVGQRLTVGAGSVGPQHVDLDPESFASGPVGGTVLVGSDDGRTSRLSMIDVAAGCAWSVATSGDVIRHATVSRDGRSIVEFRVDRRTRSDLGVWRRPLDGARGARLLGPIAPDARFGPTWLTHLSWSDESDTLVVESCGEVACRYRLVDTTSGAMVSVSDPGAGDLVGLVDKRLIVHGACRGLPCPLLALDPSGGAGLVLDDAAGQAVLARDGAGRPVVVHEVDPDGGVIRAVGPDGRGPELLPFATDGRRLIGGPGRSSGAAEHGRDWVLVGPDGRLRVEGPVPAVLRHVPDGLTVPLGEVTR
jgi:hypothetical protein